MNTSLFVATVVALGSLVLANSQTPAPSQPAASAEWKIPAGVTPKKVSAAKFESEYAWVGKPQTMHVVTYLGQRDGRAYIQRKSKSLVGGKWTAHVIYAELSELEVRFRDSLPKPAGNDAK